MLEAIALRKETRSTVEFRKLSGSGDFSLLLSFDGSKRKETQCKTLGAICSETFRAIANFNINMNFLRSTMLSNE
jgi:hypothetical protein